MEETEMTLLCPGCSSDVADYEVIEDGDYIKLDCPTCEEPQYRQNPASRNFSDFDTRGTAATQEELEMKEKMLDNEVTLTDSLSEEGTCARPTCTETENLRRKEYDETHVLDRSGPLCPDHFPGEE